MKTKEYLEAFDKGKELAYADNDFISKKVIDKKLDEAFKDCEVDCEGIRDELKQSLKSIHNPQVTHSNCVKEDCPSKSSLSVDSQEGCGKEFIHEDYDDVMCGEVMDFEDEEKQETRWGYLLCSSCKEKKE